MTKSLIDFMYDFLEYNECTEGKHNCHADADCIDTRDEFYCKCKPGYTGDGVFCQGIYE